MYKLDLPLDRKEAAAIERRRAQEEERKSRIFNAKTRLIGIDTQALDYQVRDKQQMDIMEKRREEAFFADATRNDKIACLLQQRQDHDQRELAKALNEFRGLHQQPNSRREWDLYDPDSLKKDKPARVNDDDPRCGSSSLQKFEGEDLNNKARLKYQQEQMRHWNEEQARAKAQADKNQKRADYLNDLKMRELDDRAVELQKAEEACRRAINSATADYNQALAREKATRDDLRKRQDEDDKATEIANQIMGDVLTENPGVAQSSFGAHRVVPDRWKGMSPEQLADIRREQDQQMQDRKRREMEENRRDQEWDNLRSGHARAGELLEREKERREEDIRKQLADENRRLGMEQNQHKEYLDKHVYTNPPTAAYFMQFNTTTR